MQYRFWLGPSRPKRANQSIDLEAYRPTDTKKLPDAITVQPVQPDEELETLW